MPCAACRAGPVAVRVMQGLLVKVTEQDAGKPEGGPVSFFSLKMNPGGFLTFHGEHNIINKMF